MFGVWVALSAANEAPPARFHDAIERPAFAAPEPEVALGEQAPRVRDAYDQNMRVARAGAIMAAAGYAGIVAGGMVIFAGAQQTSDELVTAGVVVAIGGGISAVAGPIMMTAGSLSAAARLRDMGAPVSTAGGWTSVGLLGGSLLVPFLHPFSMIGSGAQMAVNGKARRGIDDGSPARVQPRASMGYDPRRQVVSLNVVF